MRYLLITAEDDVATALEVVIAAIPDVKVDEHLGGCCCKNCPWGGDHP